jgi:6-phosphofructokinase 1
VHAGMAGKTDTVIGSWRRRLTHVPIPLAVSSRKKVDTDGYLWQTVLSVTGQAQDLLSAQRPERIAGALTPAKCEGLR